MEPANGEKGTGGKLTLTLGQRNRTATYEGGTRATNTLLVLNNTRTASGRT